MPSSLLALAMAMSASAQQLKDIQTTNAALVLKDQGSFFVGGRQVEQNFIETGSFGYPGHITIEQMYVE